MQNLSGTLLMCFIFYLFYAEKTGTFFGSHSGLSWSFLGLVLKHLIGHFLGQ